VFYIFSPRYSFNSRKVGKRVFTKGELVTQILEDMCGRAGLFSFISVDKK